MAGGSISPPGVDVIQTFVTTSPSIITPAMPTVLVGPAFQNVDAFDDSGNPQVEAYAGTYRNGLGTIAYNLPSLLAQASLVGFADDVRVFLVYGTETVELHSVADEELVSDGDGVYTTSTKKLTDGSQAFTQIGVEVGDVVRFTWRGEEMDVAITAVDSDTVLTLAASVLDENLASVEYEIVRNPAEFIFDAVTQANAEYGDDADYLRITAALLQADGETPATYIGSAGDELTVLIAGSQQFLSGELGAVGDAIFEDTGGGNFLTSVGSRGAVSGTPAYIQVGVLGAGQTLREVLAVVSNDILIIESGEGTLSTQNWAVGDEAATGEDGVTNSDTSFVSATATFLTSIPNTAGTPDAVTYIEIAGDGVYAVATVSSNTTLVLGTATSGTAVGQDYTVITVVASGTGDGETKADTVFVQADSAVDLTTLTDTATKSINLEGVEAATLTVVDANEITLGASLTDGGLLSWSVVQTTSPLTLTWDPETEQVLIQAERALGLSVSTFDDVELALTDEDDASYNVIVSNLITGLVGGTVGDGATVLSDVVLGDGILLTLDGGSNDEQLLLDADLLASATPTAQVYVSYRALRLDVSSSGAEGTLYEVNGQDERLALLGPATVNNPLSLAAFFAITNSPNRPIKVLGVNAVSATKPSGTLESYIAAFEFLESRRVHLVVPLTTDLAVAGALQAHIDAMSEPTERSERIGFFNSPLPAYRNATILASGESGNTGTFVGEAAAEFSASIDFRAQGVQAGDILVVGSLASATNSPAAVNGTIGPLYGIAVVSIKTGDDFVLVLDGTDGGIGAGWDDLVDVGFTVYRAGAAITQAADQAEAVAQVGEGFVNRRLFHHWPDEVTADVGGIASIISGVHAAAAWGGKANATRADKGFSNTSVAGFTGVRHSTGYFSKSQLNRMAGGGTWITIQESQGAALKCRHQLATDTTSVERREFSITRVVDYVAEYLRNGLNKQTGKFNITQSYLDALATSVSGLLESLIGTILIDARLVSLAVNDVQPDKVDIVVAIDPPYPGNYIEVTLQV